MTKDISIAVAGAAGRMGHLIIQQILKSQHACLTGAKVSAASPLEGCPLSKAHPEASEDVMFTSLASQAFKDANIIIDFTTPEALSSHLEVAQEKGIGLVIGTTGLSKDQFQILEKAALNIPILYSANFSLGIAILQHAVKEAAQKLGTDFDIEILEMHHRYKQDSPSGTALALAQAAAEGRRAILEEKSQYDRRRQRQAHLEGEIGFASLRGGSVIGDHSVIFASDEEMVEFSHRALARDVFAKGAIKAALWLAKQTPGYYKFADILTTREADVSL